VIGVYMSLFTGPGLSAFVAALARRRFSLSELVPWLAARGLLPRWVRANRGVRMPRRVAGSGDAHTELTTSRER
jgi:hypothetical protein